MIEKRRGPWRDPSIAQLDDETLHVHIEAATSQLEEAEDKVIHLEKDKDAILSDASRRHELPLIESELWKHRMEIKVVGGRLMKLQKEEKRRSGTT